MKRKYLLIVVAAALFAACAEKETLNQVIDNSEPIKIAFDAFNSKKTRAAIETEVDLTKANGGMSVYAYKYSSDDNIDVVNHVIDFSSISGKYTNPIFDNTMVYYNYDANTAANYHEKFTYDYPRYWDKQMSYVFFAYAPQDVTAGAVILDDETGLFEFKNIYKVQCASDAQDKAVDSGVGTETKKQYSVIEDVESSDAEYTAKHAAYLASNNYTIKDYLLAPCQAGEKWHGTNQMGNGSYFNNGTAYDKANITVGFTFSHLLSKLNVKVKAKNEWNGEFDLNGNSTIEDDEKFYGHEYKGIESIYITKLEITKLPQISDAYLTSCQQNEVDFSSIYSGTAVTYNPGTYPSSSLDIVGASGTNKFKINGEDNLDEALFILAGGSVEEDQTTHDLTFTCPGKKSVDGYVDQAFTYYIAPSALANNDKHELVIDYFIKYVDGREELVSRTIDLTPYSFTELKPSFIYNISLEISLDQIYITVDDAAWEEDSHPVVVPTEKL